ncbi:MAG TPA: glycosyltransferase family 2 protein, partial [Bacteroidales bacterium]|nr:glycosyltransferase family 2 protein [Bacteroidales bacterium]
LSLDSDTIVAQNYLEKIYENFLKKDIALANIFFEHNIESCKVSEEVNAISSYELHLRYYRAALKYSGFPYYYHTLGSAFAVRASTYALQGGMNKRKAGEDFYFLHKLFSLNKNIEISDTCVYPSPRISDRVPFGTGASMRQLSKVSGEIFFLTYSLNAFLDLKNLFSKVSLFYRIKEIQLIKEVDSLNIPLKNFLQTVDFADVINEINKNSSNTDSFNKRFFNFFNGFRVMKYLNYSHIEHYHRSKTETQAKHLAEILTTGKIFSEDCQSLLKFYIGLEKGNI